MQALSTKFGYLATVVYINKPKGITYPDLTEVMSCLTGIPPLVNNASNGKEYLYYKEILELVSNASILFIHEYLTPIFNLSSLTQYMNQALIDRPYRLCKNTYISNIISNG